MDYLNGLLAPLERKNGWTVAEQVGQLRPDGVQRLLNHSEWDADAVRDDVRDFVVESIGARDGGCSLTVLSALRACCRYWKPAAAF